MRLYRIQATDGMEHLIDIKAENGDHLLVDYIHRLGGLECKAEESLNRCLFEELVDWGILTPV